MNDYKGYSIVDYSKTYGKNSFSCPGCIWVFHSVNKLKEYIDEHDSIKPSETGTMEYIGTVID